jgi:hypothetical protein
MGAENSDSTFAIKTTTRTEYTRWCKMLKQKSRCKNKILKKAKNLLE